MMNNHKYARSQAGVSLIEALVALAVMAFGMLGMVGMQATLRSNSDVSKQRAEAVRIGQASLERSRAFEQLVTGAVADFADIDNSVATEPGTNATFTVTTTVVPGPAIPATAPKIKTVAVNVGWTDRADQSHAVNLISTIAGIAPHLAGSLGLPNDRAATLRPRGRHQNIPQAAVESQGTGTSVFTPANGGGVTWVFNNTSGLITSVCSAAQVCTAVDRFLLSGFIRFAIGAEPTGAEAEQPVDAPSPGLAGIGVEVRMTVPAVAVVSCFTQAATATSIAYYCAMPTTTAPNLWSGRTYVTGLDSVLSASMADFTAAHYKVCRYTPERNHTPAGGNVSHPLDYANVTGALTQQNFLIISAGNGAAPGFACPPDGPLDFVNGNTFEHQPST